VSAFIGTMHIIAVHVLLLCRTYSVQGVVEIINNRGEDMDRIYIEPPEATVLTDEDSADEDTGGLIDNLTGRQLRAGTHAVC